MSEDPYRQLIRSLGIVIQGNFFGLAIKNTLVTIPRSQIRAISGNSDEDGTVIITIQLKGSIKELDGNLIIINIRKEIYKNIHDIDPHKIAFKLCEQFALKLIP